MGDCPDAPFHDLYEVFLNETMLYPASPGSDSTTTSTSDASENPSPPLTPSPPPHSRASYAINLPLNIDVMYFNLSSLYGPPGPVTQDDSGSVTDASYGTSDMVKSVIINNNLKLLFLMLAVDPRSPSAPQNAPALTSSNVEITLTGRRDKALPSLNESLPVDLMPSSLSSSSLWSISLVITRGLQNTTNNTSFVSSSLPLQSFDIHDPPTPTSTPSSSSATTQSTSSSPSTLSTHSDTTTATSDRVISARAAAQAMFDAARQGTYKVEGITPPELMGESTPPTASSASASSPPTSIPETPSGLTSPPATSTAPAAPSDEPFSQAELDELFDPKPKRHLTTQSKRKASTPSSSRSTKAQGKRHNGSRSASRQGQASSRSGRGSSSQTRTGTGAGAGTNPSTTSTDIETGGLSGRNPRSTRSAVGNLLSALHRKQVDAEARLGRLARGEESLKGQGLPDYISDLPLSQWATQDTSSQNSVPTNRGEESSRPNRRVGRSLLAYVEDLSTLEKSSSTTTLTYPSTNDAPPSAPVTPQTKLRRLPIKVVGSDSVKANQPKTMPQATQLSDAHLSDTNTKVSSYPGASSALFVKSKTSAPSPRRIFHDVDPSDPLIIAEDFALIQSFFGHHLRPSGSPTNVRKLSSLDPSLIADVLSGVYDPVANAPQSDSDHHPLYPRQPFPSYSPSDPLVDAEDVAAEHLLDWETARLQDMVRRGNSTDGSLSSAYLRSLRHPPIPGSPSSIPGVSIEAVHSSLLPKTTPIDPQSSASQASTSTDQGYILRGSPSWDLHVQKIVDAMRNAKQKDLWLQRVRLAQAVWRTLERERADELAVIGRGHEPVYPWDIQLGADRYVTTTTTIELAV